MSVTLQEALDGARYVETRGPELSPVIWVWHGGHTVNGYMFKGGTEAPPKLHPGKVISVGDFKTGEVTVEDVKEGIESTHSPD